jgi:Transposase DNA-binding/Transposase DDE domain
MARSSTDVVRARGSLREEMATGDLGDARLNARRNHVMTALEQSPDVGFPEACADGSETEALYRFLRNRRVSFETVLTPHLEATGARCRALDEVLIIHDTTEMSFPGEQPRRGLTPLGPRRYGFWFHAALAVSADGLRAPLGLIAVAPFTRPASPGSKGSWRKRFRDPRKESRRWADGVTAVRSRVTAPRQAIHVMDREGDSYELFAALTAHGDRCVVRVHYDRQVNGGEASAPTRLSAIRAQTAVRVERHVTVAARRAEDRAQRLAHPARQGRVATVSFAASPVVLHRPRDHRSSALPPTLAINVVFGWEAHPPPGETPVEWWLATTERIDTVEDILQIVEWYRTRWLIEEFFKCLKTGCAYEKRQLESLDTLLVALALLAPIAWQLLLLRHLARELPETRATVALTPRQIAILRTMPGGTTLAATPSMRDALLLVARLGGHLRQNGEPGWLVLTRGMQKLRDMEAGWAAATRAGMM